MKAAVRRAAERELDLKISDKPFDDPQILGSPYRVRVEGTYLGWTSRDRCDELRRIYAETPSRLRKGSDPRPLTLGDLPGRVGMLLRRARELEADASIGQKNVADGVGQLRREIEMLHERVLLLEQEERRAVG